MTRSLEDWAGVKHLSLTLVFTDIVSSTALGQSIGDDRWIVDLAEHFRIGRKLAAEFDHHVVKVIGDAFMIAFRNSVEAVEFALAFSKNTGRDYIGIRAGIHTGRVEIMDNDIYGLSVNKAARIQSHSQREGILTSDPVKEDYVKAKGVIARGLFFPATGEVKNFAGTQLWQVLNAGLKSTYIATYKQRKNVLKAMKAPAK